MKIWNLEILMLAEKFKRLLRFSRTGQWALANVSLGKWRGFENSVITTFNTFILVRSVIKFLDRNFIFSEKV